MANNYQESKRRFQKNNRSNNDKPTNLKATVPLFYVEGQGSYTTNGTKFDIESLDSILAALNDINAFRMVSHSVYMKKADVFTESENAKGNVAVGYIRNITNNGDVNITINNRYIDAFKRINEPTLQVNGRIKDNQMTTILSFIIGEYADLYDQYCSDSYECDAVEEATEEE